MASFADLGDISNNVEFNSRVAYAMAVAAVSVYSETPSTTGHLTRAAFATKVLAGQYNLHFVTLAVLANSTIAAEATAIGTGNSVPDGDIQFTINSLWNVLAGA